MVIEINIQIHRYTYKKSNKFKEMSKILRLSSNYEKKLIIMIIYDLINSTSRVMQSYISVSVDHFICIIVTDYEFTGNK